MFCPFHQYYPLLIGVYSIERHCIFITRMLIKKAIVLEFTRLSGEAARVSVGLHSTAAMTWQDTEIGRVPWLVEQTLA